MTLRAVRKEKKKGKRKRKKQREKRLWKRKKSSKVGVHIYPPPALEYVTIPPIYF